MEAQRIALLQQMPIFGALSAATLNLLLDATERVHVPAGDCFVREGDLGDVLLVLESGRVVGLGTHKDLMRDCQTYQEIANSQLSKEELA